MNLNKFKKKKKKPKALLLDKLKIKCRALEETNKQIKRQENNILAIIMIVVIFSDDHVVKSYMRSYYPYLFYSIVFLCN